MIASIIPRDEISAIPARLCVIQVNEWKAYAERVAAANSIRTIKWYTGGISILKGQDSRERRHHQLTNPSQRRETSTGAPTSHCISYSIKTRMTRLARQFQRVLREQIL